MAGIKNKIHLTGTPQERARQTLEAAGWYSGRNADISKVLEFYNKLNIKLSEAAIAFFREYYGIVDRWYYYENDSQKHGWDFTFDLFPSAVDIDGDGSGCFKSEYIMNGEKEIRKIVNENIVLVGIIGYYYPALIWIGNSGKIYKWHHSCGPIVAESLSHDSIIDFIVSELRMHDYYYVTMEPIAEKINEENNIGG